MTTNCPQCGPSVPSHRRAVYELGIVRTLAGIGLAFGGIVDMRAEFTRSPSPSVEHYKLERLCTDWERLTHEIIGTLSTLTKEVGLMDGTLTSSDLMFLDRSHPEYARAAHLKAIVDCHEELVDVEFGELPDIPLSPEVQAAYQADVERLWLQAVEQVHAQQGSNES
jgi:hypothetical protein